jgi:hypothetical protein
MPLSFNITRYYTKLKSTEKTIQESQFSRRIKAKEEAKEEAKKYTHF